MPKRQGYTVKPKGKTYSQKNPVLSRPNMDKLTTPKKRRKK